jgi:hypothetical protein
VAGTERSYLFFIWPSLLNTKLIFNAFPLIITSVTRAKGWLENDDIEEENFPDCVEIVDHDQIMVVEGLSNVYFGEEGQPVFRREHDPAIMLDPLSKRPLIA